MLISLNLIKKYIDLPKGITSQSLAEKLTMSTVEVEDVVSKGAKLDNIVVGKVLKITKHPQADKLKLAQVDIGEPKPYQVVCGGTNLKTGILVAFAKVGAKIHWHGAGDLIELKSAKIRGEKSDGMICAADEIGLQDMFPHEQMQILDLSHLNLKIGEPLAKALNLDDVILDIDNKSITNRPDLWSHYGLARELAAIYNIALKPLGLYENITLKKGKTDDLKIEVKDKDLCPRYLGAVIKNIQIGESPDWLKQFLLSIGLKPINNIVDITNYVMFEVGQPLHAFDKNKIAQKIIVRRAKPGEKFITLDNEERELISDTLVIADTKKSIALAGIMGGQNSEISDNTTEVILEAATFDPISIRKTSQALGLRTESSIRFEKNLDANLAEVGLRRALQLISEIMPDAQIENEVAEVKSQEQANIDIGLSIEFIQKRIGKNISIAEAAGLLERLNFKVKIDQNLLSVLIPSWRATGDVSLPEDIVEEVARIYGYENIESDYPEVSLRPNKEDSLNNEIHKVKDILALGCGLNEIYNYAFISEKMLTNSLLAKDEVISILNPLSIDQALLRPSLLPGLLQNVKDNARFYNEFKLFEIGRVFTSKTGEFNIKGTSQTKLPDQPYKIGGVVCTNKKSEIFLEAKGIVESIINSTIKLEVKDCKLKFLNKYKYLDIIKSSRSIGWLGEISDEVLKNNGIKNRRVAAFELDISGVLESAPIKYTPLPKFPSITRDIAIEVGWNVKWGEVKEFILNEVKDPVLKEISFLSEYPLGEKKSLAFSVLYQGYRTLKDEEIEVIQSKIIKILSSKFNAKLRS